MGWTISKKFSFDAAHRLEGLADGHKCGNLHGHTYSVEVCISADSLDEHGFIIDFADLNPVKQLIDSHYDHKFLNDVMPFPINATSENLASILYEQITTIFRIRQSYVETGPLDIAIDLPRIGTALIRAVKPLREGVKIKAVRVSETGSSWAEYTNL